MKNYLPVLLISLCWTVSAQHTVETIPNTKLSTGSYVSDANHILTEQTISQIDSILSRLESATTVQVAVVAVNSIGDNDLFEFSLSEEENRYSEWYSSVQMVVKAKQDSFNVNRAAEILSHLRELFSINAEYNS